MKKENSNIQSTKITTEYIMSYEAPLDPPLAIDEGMMIVNVREGGWVAGPKINGKFIAPGADWLRIMPSGNFRLDVRGLIKTDDDAYIYVEYSGRADMESNLIAAAPTFQTGSKKYDWLNKIQVVAAGEIDTKAALTYTLYEVIVSSND